LPPTATAVTFMNKVSDNLTAEALLKMLAAEKFGTPGSATAGTSAVCAFLNGIGIDTTKIAQADGSGLSRYNLTSPSVIIRLLQAMERDTVHFPAFCFSLPIAGVDGTIAKRMRGTRAEGNLRAKTGSLSAVSALSGYVRTADGEPLAFSILMQNFPGSVRGYRTTQDRIGVLLSEIRRRDF
jgi:serine-type D-Ala-D-Ala carboxypeptidase/endopeptidase (penicillin-binding protein 4)